MILDAKIPSGPLAQKWEKHKGEIKLVNPANKRKHTVLVVGTGLAGASAAASLAVALGAAKLVILTDVAGLRVGHWTNAEARTGCTVVLLPPGTTASGEVRGGAPATRELSLLEPWRMIQAVDAVVLSGGSAFGLAACDGVVRWLEAHPDAVAVPFDLKAIYVHEKTHPPILHNQRGRAPAPSRFTADHHAADRAAPAVASARPAVRVRALRGRKRRGRRAHRPRRLALPAAAPRATRRPRTSAADGPGIRCGPPRRRAPAARRRPAPSCAGLAAARPRQPRVAVASG